MFATRSGLHPIHMLHVDLVLVVGKEDEDEAAMTEATATTTVAY